MSPKIDLYNFELYPFKVGAFFPETQCSGTNGDIIKHNVKLYS